MTARQESTVNNTSDSLQRFSFEQTPVRGEIVHLDAAWRAVVEKKDYPPVVRALLGDLTIAAVLLSASIRFSGSLTMQIKGNGPVSLLVVECTTDRTIRALAHWGGAVLPSVTDELVGKACLVMTLDPKEGKERYQAIVDFNGKTVAESLEDYLLRSDNLCTRIWIANDNRQAAGILLQKDTHDDSYNEDFWQQAVGTCTSITRNELLGLPVNELMSRFYNEPGIRVFRTDPIGFQCSCSNERVGNVIRLLGQGEIMEVLSEQGIMRIECEFCGQSYEFDSVDVMQLFRSDSHQPSSILHH